MNKKLLAVAVSGALAAPMAAHAVKYKLSGQVNRVVTYLDNGFDDDVVFTDNLSSGSRWRLSGSEDIGNGVKVGFDWEWQNSSNPSGATDIRTTGDGADSQSLRKAEVWFSGAWGKVSLGQGSGGADGSTEVDLSDTWNVAYAGRGSFGGGVSWQTDNGATITSGGTTLTHGNTFSVFDAFGRYDRVRYDTPAIGPVTISGSVGQNERYEVAARLSTGLAGGQLSGAVFYGIDNGAMIERVWGGSASYLFSQGTNITVSGARNEPEGGSDASNWYVKVGHKWANNAVSIGYGETSNIFSGFDNKGFNGGFNHNIPKAKLDVYFGFNYASLDTPSTVTEPKDLFSITAGTKLKFD